jgi:hypothetical protein
MTITKAIALLALAATLAGCETTNTPPIPLSMKSLPEFSGHMDCLAKQASSYAPVQGSPLELGIIGASACGRTRVALYDAVARQQGNTFARSYIATGREEEPKMIAAEIIRLRQR